MNLVLSKKNAFVLDMQSWSSAPGSLSSLNILLHSLAMANLHKDIKRVGTYAPHDISALSMQRTAAASGTPKPLGLRALSASAKCSSGSCDTHLHVTLVSRWGAADCNGRTNTVALQCARTSALLRQPDNAAFVAQPSHTREELQVAPFASLSGSTLCYWSYTQAALYFSALASALQRCRQQKCTAYDPG